MDLFMFYIFLWKLGNNSFFMGFFYFLIFKCGFIKLFDFIFLKNFQFLFDVILNVLFVELWDNFKMLLELLKVFDVYFYVEIMVIEDF